MKIIHLSIFILIIFSQSLNLHASPTAKKKVLYVDSYNANFWSGAIEQGIRSVLDSHNDIDLQVFRMDTKRFPSEEHKKAAALKAKEYIEKWQPDVIIASDDNAAKYLIAPYYKDSDIPVVFCGINFIASDYGFPTKNITGILSGILIDEPYNIMRPFAKGERIGFIGYDNLTAHKTFEYLSQLKDKNFTEARFPKTFEELKEAFVDIQKNVDMLFIIDAYSVKDYDLNEMIDFAQKNTVIPTSGVTYSTIKHCLLGTPKSGMEHGEWSANTALKILDGVKPSEIPIATNKHAKFYLNMPIAKKLGIKFPIDLVDSAYLIYNKDKKVLFLDLSSVKNSFSDNIKNGVLARLNVKQISDDEFDTTESDVDFCTFKRNQENKLNNTGTKKVALKARDFIKKYNPDVIIATDNQVFQYLLDNYSSEINKPFIICKQDLGIYLHKQHQDIKINNSEAKIYAEILNLARKYSKGDRLGYLGSKANTKYNHADSLAKKLNIIFNVEETASSWKELKKAFLELQKEADIIFFYNICQFNDCNDAEAREFFINNTDVPTVDFTMNMHLYALLGTRQATVEQGWIAGKAALELMTQGKLSKVQNIKKINSAIFINFNIAERLGITFSPEIIKETTPLD